MLWIALDFPCLPLDTFALPSAHTEPWAIADGTDVLVCNAPAQALGVRNGMRLSAACALSPQLNYRPRDEAAEAATLATLAAWANQFTPNVSLELPRALLLDIEGSLRLFGGIRPILQALKRGLDDMGYAATMACAPTATAALLLARAGMQKIVNCKRALEAVEASLPLAALDCDAQTAQTLQAVGVKHVAELMALPRDGLARRGGRQLLDTVDRALGRLPAPRQFFASPAQFNAKLELAAPIAHSEALLFAARRLINQLTGFLAARNGGIQRFTLTLRHERSAATRLDIGLVAPTRDLAHLTLLVRERLAALALGAPVHALDVEAGDILVLAEANRELFADRAGAQGEWQKLVERLRARLGSPAVHGVAAAAEHRPERASRAIQPGVASAAPARGPRPLWLLAAPQPLAEVAARPHYRETALALVAGPERIESGWWDDDDVKRDYFVAQTPDHATLWIYRERRAPGGWYLHGVFS
ncbi:MAG: DNA polymerase Y family protein [Betaproteobacteria bacterium]